MTLRATIDGARLLSRIKELSRLTTTPGHGVTREAWTPLDVVARDRVADWMREAGLHAEVDAAANLIGWTTSNGGRWLASGSHLDTVVHGGPLDGAYGVIAAVEVAASLRRAGHVMRHGLLVAALANEEGARGTPGMTGSHACVGDLGATVLDEPDDDGIRLRDRIAEAGGAPDHIESARWPADTIDAFVELHVEQGPVLDRTGTPIGVVSAITGRQALDVHISGTANHAGTTPMGMRRDALAAAAEIVLAVEDLPGGEGVRVATCGHLAAVPNVRNVVPGTVLLGIELRDERTEAIERAMSELDVVLEGVGERRGVTIERHWGQRVPPRLAHPAVAASVRHATAANGLDIAELPSGAGHDAQVLAAAVPIGMIFVPSIGGISHSPEERTDPEHLVAGAQVLLDTLLDLDERFPDGPWLGATP